MQIRVLYEIRSSEKPNIGSLSRLMSQNHGNCSSLCKKLEQAGLVERRRGREDERRVTLCLTDRGERAIAGVVSRLDEKLAPALAATTPEELEIMRQGMRVMEKLLQRCVLSAKEG